MVPDVSKYMQESKCRGSKWRDVGVEDADADLRFGRRVQ